jgi:hypothetical protein
MGAYMNDQQKLLVIHQPDFIPHLGFFAKLVQCDLFVILDHVQLLVKGWHHRDKIKGPNGAHWLTIPIDRSVTNPPINEARISYTQNWQDKQLQTISHFYKKAPFFKPIFTEFERIYSAKYAKLITFNLAFLDFFCDFFNISIERIFSSGLGVHSKKSQLIMDIIQNCDGDSYLSGEGARDYLDSTLFEQQRVKLIWQDFRHPTYPQLHGEFIPFLSCLDFAMNCGPNIRDYL